MPREQIPVAKRAASIEYAIRDVVVPATALEAQGHEIIKLNNSQFSLVGNDICVRSSLKN